MRSLYVVGFTRVRTPETPAGSYPMARIVHQYFRSEIPLLTNFDRTKKGNSKWLSARQKTVSMEVKKRESVEEICILMGLENSTS